MPRLKKKKKISKEEKHEEEVIWVKLDGNVWWPGVLRNGEIRFWEENYVMDPASEVIQSFTNDKNLIIKSREKLKKKKWLLKKFENDLEKALSLYGQKTCEVNKIEKDGLKQIVTGDVKEKTDQLEDDGKQKTDHSDDDDCKQKTDLSDDDDGKQKTDWSDDDDGKQKTNRSDDDDRKEKTDRSDDDDDKQKTDRSDDDDGKQKTDRSDDDDVKQKTDWSDDDAGKQKTNRSDDDDSKQKTNRSDDGGRQKTDRSDDDDGKQKTDWLNDHDAKEKTDRSDDDDGKQKTDWLNDHDAKEKTDRSDDDDGKHKTNRSDYGGRQKTDLSDDVGKQKTDWLDDDDRKEKTDHSDDDDGKQQTDRLEDDDAKEKTDRSDDDDGKQQTDRSDDDDAKEKTDRSDNDGAKEMTDQSDDNGGKEKTDQSDDDGSKEMTNQSDDDSAKEMTDQSDDDGGKEMTDQSDDERSKEMTYQSDDDDAKEMTDQSDDDGGKEMTDQSDDERSKEMTDQSDDDDGKQQTDRLEDDDAKEKTDDDGSKEMTDQSDDDGGKEKTDQSDDDDGKQQTDRLEDDDAKEKTDDDDGSKEMTDQSDDDGGKEKTDQSDDDDGKQQTDRLEDDDAKEKTDQSVDGYYNGTAEKTDRLKVVDGDEDLFSDDSVMDVDYEPDSVEEGSDSDYSVIIPLLSEHLKPSTSGRCNTLAPFESRTSVKRKLDLDDETSKRFKAGKTIETIDKSVSQSVSPEADVIRDCNVRGLYIKKYKLKKPREFKGQSKETRIYDNRHACFYCGKVVLHIADHLKTHKTVEEVKDILNSENPNFTRLRKLGDDRHNRECLEKGEGEIILARRPTDDSFDVSKYGPCPECREWLQLKGLKEHHVQCTQKKTAKKIRKKDLVVLSQVLAGHIQSKLSPLMQKEVLTIMTDDNISKTAQEDALITALGESLLRRNVSNIEKRKYYSSARMRLIAKLLQNLRELNGKPKNCEQSSDNGETLQKPPHSLWDFLRPKYFEDVVLCSLKCCFPSADDMEDLKSPSNILKLKHDIRNAVNSKWAFIVKSIGTESHIEAKECRAFLHLMEVEWTEKAQTLARAVLSRRRYEEVKELPSPKDIELLTKHLNLELNNLTLNGTTENYRRITILVQTKLLLFNKRRSGELEAIKVQSYVSRSTGLNDIDQSLANDLSDVEKYMMETQDLMKVRGKRGRPVPVLVPQNCRLPLAFLADQTSRRDSGIRPENHYLFPNSVKSYVRAYDSLKLICSELNLITPHRITSVSMRKYTATLTQMLDLDKYQIEWVCNHLGHTTKVHKEHYRQMSGLLERTQISKILLIQDLNLTSKFKGKKLQDMDIRDIVFPDDIDVAAVPEQLSVPDDSVNSEDELYLNEDKEDDKEDEEDDESETELTQTRTKKIKPKTKRQRWNQAEIKEIKIYFDEYLKSGITPRFPEIDKAKAKSKKKNGQIHLRANHLIVKKISNMNHSK